MSLVDYASSDEGSENENETEEKKQVIQTENQINKNVGNSRLGDSVSSESNIELFSSLPKPIKTFSFFEDDNKLSKLLLNKNILPFGKKENIKISVPSISEFDKDTEQPAPKKIKPCTKSAGLFSVLPPPKNTSVKQTNRNFVPYVLSKNQDKKTLSKTEVYNKDVNKTSVKELDADEDDDDDTTAGSSFFGNSLAQQNSCLETDNVDIGSTVTKENANNLAVTENPDISEIHLPEENSSQGLILNVDENNYNCFIDSSQATKTVSADDNPLELDEKALQILCGNKKKRQQMPMNIIDLSSEEVLPDSKEWLLKQFTEEKRVRSHSHKKNQGPSSQSRRKHQITYLAYQAKEQELELQNQWANNRMSRKQTQSKYGF